MSYVDKLLLSLPLTTKTKRGNRAEVRTRHRIVKVIFKNIISIHEQLFPIPNKRIPLTRSLEGSLWHGYKLVLAAYFFPGFEGLNFFM